MATKTSPTCFLLRLVFSATAVSTADLDNDFAAVLFDIITPCGKTRVATPAIGRRVETRGRVVNRIPRIFRPFARFFTRAPRRLMKMGFAGGAETVSSAKAQRRPSLGFRTF